MNLTESEALFLKGVEAVDRGNWLSALVCFEKASHRGAGPACHSYLAACIAKERGQYKKAMMLCGEALEKDPDNPVHYLNLGRIFLFRGNRKEALKIFREGLNYGMEKRIIDELEKLGKRQKPLISLLDRSNPVNKYLGIIMKKLKVR